MARHVEDLGLVLDMISGPDGKDRRVPPVAAEKSADSPTEQLEVAFFLDDGYSAPIREMQDVVRRAAITPQPRGRHDGDWPDTFAEGQDLGWN